MGLVDRRLERTSSVRTIGREEQGEGRQQKTTDRIKDVRYGRSRYQSISTVLPSCGGNIMIGLRFSVICRTCSRGIELVLVTNYSFSQPSRVLGLYRSTCGYFTQENQESFPKLKMIGGSKPDYCLLSFALLTPASILAQERGTSA